MVNYLLSFQCTIFIYLLTKNVVSHYESVKIKACQFVHFEHRKKLHKCEMKPYLMEVESVDKYNPKYCCNFQAATNSAQCSLHGLWWAMSSAS